MVTSVIFQHYLYILIGSMHNSQLNFILTFVIINLVF